MIFDTESIVSRVIAAIDGGVWSHVADYIGNGRIIEATVRGVVDRSVNAYRCLRYRIGLYRVRDAETDPNRFEKAAKYVSFARSQLGKRYGFGKALRLGIMRALHTISATPFRSLHTS